MHAARIERVRQEVVTALLAALILMTAIGAFVTAVSVIAMNISSLAHRTGLSFDDGFRPAF